tara:strand:+ start:119 stop:2734 length:2616 start_codon:yes stop_codon:yes gene_type:complete
MKTIGRDFGDVARKVYATASGTLPNGKPVVVNADGTVSVVAASGGSPSFGTAAVFESAYSTNSSSCFDSNSNRIVISYLDNGNSNYGTAVVGQVSGTAITFGTPVVFESASTSNTAAVFDANLNKIVIGYSDQGNAASGTAIVGTINASNNSISFGSATVFLQGYADKITGVFDSNSNKVVFCYRVSYETGYSSVGTVSGTGISFGSAVGFNTGGGNIGSTYSISSVFDSTNNKVVIAYRGPSNRGTGIVGTVNNTSISFGSYTAYTNNVANDNKMVFDPDTGKVVIVYNDAGNSSYATTVLGTLSGTSISFGTPAVFVSSAVSNFAPVYDTSVNKVFLAYKNTKGYYALGTVSGTSISFTSPALFYDATINSIISTFDSNSNSVVIAFTDGGNNNYGTAIAYQSSPANLTTENYIGMSSGGVEFDIGTAATGSQVVFESARANQTISVYDPNSNRVVVIYRRTGPAPGYAQSLNALVGTVSGTSISFGTSVVVVNNSVINQGIWPASVCFDSNSNKVVIGYSNASNSNYGTAIVGTVNPADNSISFGTPVVYESAAVTNSSSDFDSNSNKVVIAYSDSGNSSYGTAIVGTVSGTNISFGSPVVFESAATLYTSCAFDSNLNKMVISYSDGGNSNYGTAIVGTVSGTNISFGTAVVFEAANTGSPGNLSSTFDSNSNKIVISYRDGGNSNYATAIVGTVSGTGISFGTAVVFVSAQLNYGDTTFNSDANKVGIAFTQNTATYGYVVQGTVSGTSISFGTITTVTPATGTQNLSTAFDTTAKAYVLAYNKSSNDTGNSIVFQPAFDNTVRGEVASGGAALVNTKGAINTNQNALTAGQSYFVQTDGTIGTTAGDPSVFAGTAVSATKLIVKG